MRFLVLMFLTLGSASSAFAKAQCPNNDHENWRIGGTEIRRCITPGFCEMYDFNPETGRWETFPGPHQECMGYQTRQTAELFCQNEKGESYKDKQAGPWSICRLLPPR